MKNPKNWRVIGLGILGGLAYAGIESRLDRIALVQGSAFWTAVHDSVEWPIPIILGLSISVAVSLYIQQRDLNRRLSTENSLLKSQVLTHTLASYMLHEIRTPIHNLSAVLEKLTASVPKSDADMLERNLQRLENTTNQLKWLSALSDTINLEQSVEFSAWVQDFVTNCVARSMKKSGIRYEQELKNLKLRMHPLLLEQCFTLLFDNAIRAAQNFEGRATIVLSVIGGIPEKRGYAAIRISNSGNFPEEVLRASGKTMVKSSAGSGLGLALVNDTLKQVFGEMALANRNGMAEVTLFVPMET